MQITLRHIHWKEDVMEEMDEMKVKVDWGHRKKNVQCDHQIRAWDSKDFVTNLASAWIWVTRTEHWLFSIFLKILFLDESPVPLMLLCVLVLFSLFSSFAAADSMVNLATVNCTWPCSTQGQVCQVTSTSIQCAPPSNSQWVLLFSTCPSFFIPCLLITLRH